MRKLIILALLCAPMWAAPAFVQAGYCQSGGTSCTVTLTITGGNTIVVGAISGHTSPTLSVTDSKSQTYSTAAALHHYASSYPASTQMFYTASAAAGSTIVTCSTNDSTDYQACVVFEISGADTVDVSAVADTASTGTTGQAASGTTATTTAADEILVSLHATMQNSSSWTADTGWTIPTNGSYVGAVSIAMAYRVVSSTSAYSHSITANVLRDTIGMIATFKSGSGGAVVRRRAVIIQ